MLSVRNGFEHLEYEIYVDENPCLTCLSDGGYNGDLKDYYNCFNGVDVEHSDANGGTTADVRSDGSGVEWSGRCHR